jgi:hypothetical protein
MVLGRDPKIEAACKSANASAKSMNKRGTRNAPPNRASTTANTDQEKKAKIEGAQYQTVAMGDRL